MCLPSHVETLVSASWQRTGGCLCTHSKGGHPATPISASFTQESREQTLLARRKQLQNLGFLSNLAWPLSSFFLSTTLPKITIASITAARRHLEDPTPHQITLPYQRKLSNSIDMPALNKRLGEDVPVGTGTYIVIISLLILGLTIWIAYSIFKRAQSHFRKEDDSSDFDSEVSGLELDQSVSAETDWSSIIEWPVIEPGCNIEYNESIIDSEFRLHTNH
ncbi:hypothetical protein B0J13DRAFT_519751 [Dactylonectria estremocensis]|uniref:Uncharacterized protein n=1 Tax=Dactylonectria estremocensis TaxID=1079267 RepID=A0A9P9JBD1_9HYPO|nr:hypothetical protein B0J13DRAFT_519751 [Dactylonectria estremocensis]